MDEEIVKAICGELGPDYNLENITKLVDGILARMDEFKILQESLVKKGETLNECVRVCRERAKELREEVFPAIKAIQEYVSSLRTGVDLLENDYLEAKKKNSKFGIYYSIKKNRTKQSEVPKGDQSTFGLFSTKTDDLPVEEPQKEETKEIPMN